MVYITILDYRSFRRDLYYSPNEEIGFESERIILCQTFCRLNIRNFVNNKQQNTNETIEINAIDTDIRIGSHAFWG